MTQVIAYADRRPLSVRRRWRIPIAVAMIGIGIVCGDLALLPQTFCYECCPTPLTGFWAPEILVVTAVAYSWARVFEAPGRRSVLRSSLLAGAATVAICAAAVQILVFKRDPGTPLRWYRVEQWWPTRYALVGLAFAVVANLGVTPPAARSRWPWRGSRCG